MTGSDRFSSPDAPHLSPAELEACILHRDEDIFVLDKPGWLVCHPSKDGPWSSLVGAVREHFGLDRIHLISRLDRETSGLVVIAVNRRTSRLLQMAVERGAAEKVYETVLCGERTGSWTVEGDLCPDRRSLVHVRMRVSEGPPRGLRLPRTHFEAVTAGGGFTLCRVRTEGGRKHQIRVHAAHAGYPVAGDKLYGPDETLYLDFIEKGWTPRMEQVLPCRRQALHCASIRYDVDNWREREFRVGIPDDLREAFPGLFGAGAG